MASEARIETVRARLRELDRWYRGYLDEAHALTRELRELERIERIQAQRDLREARRVFGPGVRVVA